jgi:hypothetical protein
MYAALRALAIPDEVVARLFHAASLLREHRGDGHIAALLHADLNGLEALITYTATGRGFTEVGARATRGWRDEEWAACCGRLAERGLLDDAGLTDEGKALRARLEAATDEMSGAAWEHLGAERTARVMELAKGVARTMVTGGAFDTEVLAR